MKSQMDKLPTELINHIKEYVFSPEIKMRILLEKYRKRGHIFHGIIIDKLATFFPTEQLLRTYNHICYDRFFIRETNCASNGKYKNQIIAMIPKITYTICGIKKEDDMSFHPFLLEAYHHFYQHNQTEDVNRADIKKSLTDAFRFMTTSYSNINNLDEYIYKTAYDLLAYMSVMDKIHSQTFYDNTFRAEF
jgi:hypothetical protein